jgi:arrestin-related trafficking adapter 9
MSDIAPPQTSSPPLPSSNGRSLLSRLTAPLRPRSRNLADFHIRPLEPHRQYSPGDVVKGLVVLTVVKPIRITHLTVALHGSVRVYKSPNDGSEVSSYEPALMNGSSGRKSQYLGNGYASLFNDEVTLCGEGRLEIGVYEFEFNLELPQEGLPTSIGVRSLSISH